MKPFYEHDHDTITTHLHNKMPTILSATSSSLHASKKQHIFTIASLQPWNSDANQAQTKNPTTCHLFFLKTIFKLSSKSTTCFRQIKYFLHDDLVATHLYQALRLSNPKRCHKQTNPKSFQGIYVHLQSQLEVNFSTTSLPSLQNNIEFVIPIPKNQTSTIIRGACVLRTSA